MSKDYRIFLLTPALYPVFVVGYFLVYQWIGTALPGDTIAWGECFVIALFPVLGYVLACMFYLGIRETAWYRLES